MGKSSLYVFGTGNANATRCYNTCFALRSDNEFFMVDAGGGNGILSILKDMNVRLTDIHHIFVTHEHTDHILGVVWMIRMIAASMRKGSYQGELHIYCHDGLTSTIETLARLTVQKKFCDLIGDRIHLIPVSDGETRRILNMDLTFFDIHSSKARQYGFTAVFSDGKKLCFAGDEPLQPVCESYADKADWLLHEAFCLYSEREFFHPYEKHHSTVKEACELAERLQVKQLVLWHTEEKNLLRRKQLYTEEGSRYYHHSLLVPNDKEVIPLQTASNGRKS